MSRPQGPRREFTAPQEGLGDSAALVNVEQHVWCQFGKLKEITVPLLKGSHRLCLCVSMCPGLCSSVDDLRELVLSDIWACGCHVFLSRGHIAKVGRAVSVHLVHRCSLARPAPAVQPAAVCLSVSVALARPPLTPLSHRYIGPSTVFGSSGKLANVEQWRCVSILRSHSGGEWAARGGGTKRPVDRGASAQPCVWPPQPPACHQRHQCPHSCPHGLCVYIFNVELPTSRCLSWELSHCLISGSLSP